MEYRVNTKYISNIKVIGIMFLKERINP